MRHPHFTGLLSSAETPKEGSLLPGRYRFREGTERRDAIRQIQSAQHDVVLEIWQRRSSGSPLKTPDELITIAAIIEKEMPVLLGPESTRPGAAAATPEAFAVPSEKQHSDRAPSVLTEPRRVRTVKIRPDSPVVSPPGDRERIAAVLINRLKKKMKLQSDPTVVYALAGGRGTLERPIYRGDLVHPSPYNTYLHEGLPPGPIANPSRASLEAAANPASTDDLYFVVDGSGGYAFAATYEQHQTNVARLRAIEQRPKQPTPMGGSAPAVSSGGFR
jgi:UPF0755 protein